MKNYKRYAFLCLLLAYAELYAAAEREYYHPLLDLVEAVEGATGLPEDICDNVIIPLHGEYIAPLQQVLTIPVASEYSDGFVRQLPDGSVLVIAQDGTIARFSAHDGKLLSVIRPRLPKYVCCAELLDDERLALVCASGDLEVVGLEGEAETQIVSQGHLLLSAFVSMPAHHELLLAGYQGLVAFDTKTWKKRTLKNYAVDHLVALPSGKVVFDDKENRIADACVYNPGNQTLEEADIPMCSRHEILAACGQKLMCIKDKSLYDCIGVYDLETKAKTSNSSFRLVRQVHAAVGLRCSTAILHHGREQDASAGPWVTLFDAHGEEVQRLPEKRVEGIFPALHGGLAMLSADEHNRTMVSVWHEQTVQQLRKQRNEDLQQERQKKKKGFWATAASWFKKHG